MSSEFTVIHWRKHELVTMACVVIAFTGLVFFTIGFMAGKV